MTSLVRRGFFLRLAGCCAALALGGCAYHLGTTNGVKAGGKTIQVRPFTNKTLQPRLGDAVTQSLRKELQKDGTYRLATSGDSADILVSGVIMRYERRGMTYQSKDVVTVRDFRVDMTAHVTATDRNTGKVLLDQSVVGSTLVRAGNDLTSDERQALPLLADELAKRITDRIVDGSW
jgi:hypothetical protein